MAAGFTILDSDAINATGETTRATTDTAITPAIGDLAFFSAQNCTDSGGNLAVSGGGMTWTKLGSIITNTTPARVLGVWRATAGTPSSGALTWTATDNWIDPCYVIVRPVDLTYVGVVGSGAQDSGTSYSITVTSSGSPAALLGYGGSSGQTTWTTDSGWTSATINETVANGRMQTLQYRFSDDTAWVVDPDATGVSQAGVILEFSAAAASGGIGPLVGSGKGLIG